MATAEGYLRRLTRRLTEDPEQLDVEELNEEAASTGAQTIPSIRVKAASPESVPAMKRTFVRPERAPRTASAAAARDSARNGAVGRNLPPAATRHENVPSTAAAAAARIPNRSRARTVNGQTASALARAANSHAAVSGFPKTNARKASATG